MEVGSNEINYEGFSHNTSKLCFLVAHIIFVSELSLIGDIFVVEVSFNDDG